MSLEFKSIDKSSFVQFIGEDQRQGVEWGLKWFSVLPDLATYFAVLRQGVIVGVYFLNPYLSGFELGVYICHLQRRSGILRQLIELLSTEELYVEISQYNSLSLKVFTRFGFQAIQENANTVILKRNSRN